MKLRHKDGTVHYSDLKWFARSPAHYKASIERPRESTRAMRVGTVVHRLVLGPSARAVVRFDGDSRRGKAWEAFEAAHRADHEIVTAPEWDDAVPIAEAVLRDPVAARLLEGSAFEKPLAWTSAGVEMSTRGLDFVHRERRYFGDLKVTSNTAPERFQKHSIDMLYHAQLANYDEGARANGIDTSGGIFIIGVEDTYPHIVTVLEMTEPMIELGRRCITLWLERLKQCEAADVWPGYASAPVPFVMPPWMDEKKSLTDEEEAA